jgi:DNA modification methylase
MLTLTKHLIINGDSRRMLELQDNSIDLVVTSPPYWQLKDYGSAREFIEKKVNSQKVFLKFDEVKYDNENNLLCYLYLKNKTFMNAHLIKNGYAFADREANYKYKSKFIGLEQANV